MSIKDVVHMIAEAAEFKGNIIVWQLISALHSTTALL